VALLLIMQVVAAVALMPEARGAVALVVEEMAEGQLL